MHLRSLLAFCLSLASLRAELTLDTTFNPPLPAPQANWSGYTVAGTSPDGAVYIHRQDTDGRVVRVRDDGAVDTTFNPTLTTHLANTSGSLEINHRDGSGAPVAAGLFLDGAQRTLLARLTPSGAVDATFTPVRAPHADTLWAWADETFDGAHYIVHHERYSSPDDAWVSGFTVVRATDGQPVPNFPPPGEELEISERWGDGTFLVSGRSLDAGGQTESLLRYLPNFQRDPSFDAPTFAVTPADEEMWLNIWEGEDHYFVAPQTLGHVTINGQPAGAVHRLRDDGSPDPAFTPFQPPTLRGHPAYWTTLEEVSDGDDADRSLLVSTLHGPDGGTGRYLARFHLLDGSTGARHAPFDVVVEMEGTDDDAWGEVIVEEDNDVSLERVRIGLGSGAVSAGGQPVPTGATAAIFALDGALVRFEMQEDNAAQLEGIDEESQQLVPVMYRDSFHFPDGSELVYSTWPELTHVDGEPVEGMVLLSPDGSWDRSVVLVPSYPSANFFRAINVDESAPGKLVVTGNFTAINGAPRPGVARLLFTPSGPPEWTDTYGLVEDPVALATDDSDDDGVPDLLELAFRLNPLVPDATSLAPGAERGLPAPAVSNPSSPRLQLRYLRRRDRAELGLTYTPEFASGLTGGWAGGTELSAEVVDDTWELVTVEDSAAPAGVTFRVGRIVVGL